MTSPGRQDLALRKRDRPRRDLHGHGGLAGGLAAHQVSLDGPRPYPTTTTCSTAPMPAPTPTGTSRMPSAPKGTPDEPAEEDVQRRPTRERAAEAKAKADASAPPRQPQPPDRRADRGGPHRAHLRRRLVLEEGQRLQRRAGLERRAARRRGPGDLRACRSAPAPSGPAAAALGGLPVPGVQQLEDTNGKGITDLATAGTIRPLWRPTTFLDVNLKNDSSARAAAAWGCAVDAGQGPRVPHDGLRQPAHGRCRLHRRAAADVRQGRGPHRGGVRHVQRLRGGQKFTGWVTNSFRPVLQRGRARDPGRLPVLGDKKTEVPAATMADQAKLEQAIKDFQTS